MACEVGRQVGPAVCPMPYSEAAGQSGEWLHGHLEEPVHVATRGAEIMNVGLILTDTIARRGRVERWPHRFVRQPLRAGRAAIASAASSAVEATALPAVASGVHLGGRIVLR